MFARRISHGMPPGGAGLSEKGGVCVPSGMDLFEIIIFALIAGSGLIGEILKKRRQRENTSKTGTSRTYPSGLDYEEAETEEPVRIGSRAPDRSAQTGGREPSPWEEGFDRSTRSTTTSSRTSRESPRSTHSDSESGGRPSARGGVPETTPGGGIETLFDLDRLLEEALTGGRRRGGGQGPGRVEPSTSSTPATGPMGGGRSREARASLENTASDESATLSRLGSRESVRRMGSGRRAETAKQAAPSPLDQSPTARRSTGSAATSRHRRTGWLANPEQVRQAVIASEILARPKALRRPGESPRGARRP